MTKSDSLPGDAVKLTISGAGSKSGPLALCEPAVPCGHCGTAITRTDTERSSVPCKVIRSTGTCAGRRNLASRKPSIGFTKPKPIGMPLSPNCAVPTTSNMERSSGGAGPALVSRSSCDSSTAYCSSRKPCITRTSRRPGAAFAKRSASSTTHCSAAGRPAGGVSVRCQRSRAMGPAVVCMPTGACATANDVSAIVASIFMRMQPFAVAHTRFSDCSDLNTASVQAHGFAGELQCLRWLMRARCC